MEALFKKLNFKEQGKVLFAAAPESMAEAIAWMRSRVEVLIDDSKATDCDFAMGFATTQAGLDALSQQLAAAVPGDGIIWICYPKGSSKKYKCEFNRDTGWTVLGTLGFEPVRQVAVDDDWSALRFRRVSYIKTLTRSKDMSLTEEAKRRTTGR